MRNMHEINAMKVRVDYLGYIKNMLDKNEEFDIRRCYTFRIA